MPNLFDDLDELGTSLKGAFNATRVRLEGDPEKRRALEDRLLKERREGEKRKSLFGGASDALEAGDIDEGLDLRESLDPNAATERRLREAEGGPLTMEEVREEQLRAREIVRKRQQGEPVSDEEKLIVFRVVTDAIKGMAGEREKQLRKQFGGGEDPNQQGAPTQPV